MEDTILKDKEYYDIIKDILESDEFQKRKNFKHHDDSVYEHCLKVSYKSYLLAKKIGANYKDCAIAGLLHDFYKKLNTFYIIFILNYKYHSNLSKFYFNPL